ncbi:citrate lyase acyl carrier protein [Hafnia psychrotolerans]|jgi:citrate lyase subunit gamma (acyl carrier protein)|uniref:Citrate lyase acyl carrier protein n=1 Tax=Hafnia psychrotolerans TaxID=1477018 RepID=A0ABQ1FXB8_9GAMM|nr:citrate lyase acyl carrier protein [Hafnia psychrotolerans]GGA32919.1 citrate lyase acyl carrier protein [Hafnia psychrotolerans]
MNIIRETLAGTLESSDVMVRVAPNPTHVDLQLNSTVEKQFGQQIRLRIAEVLKELQIETVTLVVDDKGALDCVLRARLETALIRASDQNPHQWEAC